MNNTLNMFSNIAVLVAIATSNANAIGAPKTIVYDNIPPALGCVVNQTCTVAEGLVHQYKDRIKEDNAIAAVAGYSCRSDTLYAEPPSRVKAQRAWEAAWWGDADSNIDKPMRLDMKFVTIGTYVCDLMGEHRYDKMKEIEHFVDLYNNDMKDTGWVFNNTNYSAHTWATKIITVRKM